MALGCEMSEIMGYSEPVLSIVIPARNERRNIGRCLSSILNGGYSELEVVVVDDCSTDGTADEVRASYGAHPAVRLIESKGLCTGWTGKNWAVHRGAMEARGKWLLFLDADTELYPNALNDSLLLASTNGIDLLSYSPEQELRGFWERAVQPVVFDILDGCYAFDSVNDPASAEAAANGQFILIRREAYLEAGGHEAVRGEIVEDVALARNVKAAGSSIFFAPGKGMVKCRMYQSLGEIFEGWSKNLYELIGGGWSDLMRVVFSLGSRSLFPAVIFAASLVFMARYHHREPLGALAVLYALLAAVNLVRAVLSPGGRSNSSPLSGFFLYSLGSLVVISLLLTSTAKSALRIGHTWKGRRYSAGEAGNGGRLLQ